MPGTREWPSVPRRSSRSPPSKLLLEPFRGELQALVGVDAGLPAQLGARAGDVRPAHLGIVDGEGTEDDLAARVGDSQDTLGQLEQGHFMRVADVHGLARPA